MDRITTKIVSAACILTVTVLLPRAYSQSPGVVPAEAVYKNIKALRGVPSDQLAQVMLFFEAALGVGCDHCHAADRAADTPVKETARRMISMVNAINRDNFKGAKTVTCNTCHRGATVTQARPGFATETYEPWTPDAPTPLPPVPGPPASQLIDDYLKTLGGEAGLAKLQSRIVKYTITDSIGRVTHMEMVNKGDNNLSIIRGLDGEVILARTGNSGWRRAPNGAVRDTWQDEFDDLRLQNPLYLATHLKSDITNMETRRTRLHDQEVYQIRGTLFGRIPMRLFIHPKSGNLLRFAYAAPHAMGQRAVEIDYYDFRNVQGGAFPFKWIVKEALSYQTVQVDSIEQNVPVEDMRFARPTGRSN